MPDPSRPARFNATMQTTLTGTDWLELIPLSQSRLQIPVKLIMQQRELTATCWGGTEWHLESLLVDTAALQKEQMLPNSGPERISLNTHTAGDKSSAGNTPAGNTPVGNTPVGNTLKRELWQGFNVYLYRDACERYWHALIGDQPRIYIICIADVDTGTPEPIKVTIDYDEALAHSETDGTVIDSEIPSMLYQIMERFVVTHYHPKEFKKRKRRNWSQETDQPETDQASSAGLAAQTQENPRVPAESQQIIEELNLPSIESLTANSDISGFLDQRVPGWLRRRAFSTLFSQSAFNIRDGLNDYDEDYTSFEPLGDTITADMRFQMERQQALEEQAANEALEQPEQVAESNNEDAMPDPEAPVLHELDTDNTEEAELQASVDPATIPEATIHDKQVPQPDSPEVPA